MLLKKSLLVIAISSALLSACSTSQLSNTTNTGNVVEQQSAKLAVSESEKANLLFDSIFNASIDRNPVMQTYLGIKKDYDKLENSIHDYQWRFHNYPVNQMFGTHSQVPAFLINQHSISNLKEAQDYIARVKGTNKIMKQLVTQLQLREEQGIIAPKFVFEHVIRDASNI